MFISDVGIAIKIWWNKDRFICVVLQTYVQSKNLFARCHIQPCRALAYLSFVLFFSFNFPLSNLISISIFFYFCCTRTTASWKVDFHLAYLLSLFVLRKFRDNYWSRCKPMRNKAKEAGNQPNCTVQSVHKQWGQ